MATAADIEQLYRDVLGREADASGLDYYTNALSSGTSYEDIRNSFLSSTENLVQDQYVDLLGRQPDAEGMAYWSNQTDLSGLTSEDIQQGIKNSAEYQAQLAANPSQFDTSAAQLGEAADIFRNVASTNIPGVTPSTYDPMMAQATTYNPNVLRDQDISAYMNPYTQEVIDRSMQDIERNRLMQTNQMDAQAGAAGAFGGSRHGVAQSLTNEAFAKQAADTSANLRNLGFGNAQNMALQDVGTMNQALQFGAGAQNTMGLANQGAYNQAGQFGAGQNMLAQQLNQNAALQAGAMQLNAGTSLGNLSNTGFNQANTINQQQMSFGSLQQQMNQLLANNANQQYQFAQQAPMNAFNLGMGVLGGYPGMQTATGTGQPGLIGTIGMLGNAGAFS